MKGLACDLQAILFVRGEAVAIAEAATILGISEDEVSVAADELREALVGSALTVVGEGDRFELVTVPEMADVVRSLEDDATESLSKAASETLAVVAYRGPLSRQEVSGIRGVESRAMLRQLERRSLVNRTKGDSGVLMYDITVEALKELGVTNREMLPEYEVLSSHERLEQLLEESEL